MNTSSPRRLSLPSKLVSRVQDAVRAVAIRSRAALEGKRFVPFLVVVTGQKCTLRCRDCGNFTPYLPQTFYESELIAADLELLARSWAVGAVQVQGGEALIHPDLPRILRACAPLAGDVTIATNGTRLLTDLQVAVMLKIGGRLRISNYGIVAQRHGELLEQCRQLGIRAELYEFSQGTGQWWEMGHRQMPRSTLDRAGQVFASCPYRGCLTLEDGTLARCSRATVSHLVQGFTPGPSDLLGLRSLPVSETRRILDDYVAHPRIMEACHYCLGGTGPEVPPALQLKGQLPPTERWPVSGLRRDTTP